MATCVCLGDELASYGFGQSHPFGNDRLFAFRREFEARGLDRRTRILEAARGDRELLELFHSPEYLDFLQAASRGGGGFLDSGDTPVFPGIFEACLWVTGSVCRAADELLDGNCDSALVPIAGLHHARRDGAAGFCAVNDCGVLVEYLKQRHGLERIAYVDIDAHHGDGVFYAFESDPALIFVDFHEDGRYLYPGTGRVTETGKGPATGLKLNVPLPTKADDRLFGKLWPRAGEFVARHRPEFIILQAGADSIRGDPITHLALSPASHARVAGDLAQLGAPLLVLGGGGYDRDNLARAWTGVVEALLEYSPGH